MANIKFSQFTQKTTLGTVDFLVGYTGADNVQIDPADLLSDYSQGTGAAGQVTFFSATSTVTGDNNLYWDNTNKRLGIGTSSPVSALHVESANSNINLIAPSGNPFFRMANATSGSRKELTFTYDMASNYASIQAIEQGVATRNIAINPSGGNVGIGTTTLAAKLHVDGTLIATGISQLGSGGSNVLLTSSSAGSVGIGTSSPSYKLDIYGDAVGGVVRVKNASNGRDTLRSENAAGTRTLNFGNDGSGHGLFIIRDSSGGVRNYITGSGDSYFNGGNVGIGTSSPSYKLDVRKNQAGYTYIASDNANTAASGTGSGFAMTEGGSVAWYLRNERDGSGKFNIGNSANRLTIDSSGNVGIGTTSPTQTLDVDGAIITEDYRAASIFYLTSGDDWRFRSDTGSERMRITSSGDVGIGTASPAKELDVEGEALFGNGTNGLLFSYSNANSSGIIDTGHSSTALEFRVGNTQELLINGSSATFAGTVLIDGVSNYTGLEVKGVGGSRPEIKWSNANNGNLGNIYGTETNSLVIATGSSGTTALTLDSSQNATFAGDVEIADSSKGIILESPDGTRYRVTVANGGTLSVSAV